MVLAGACLSACQKDALVPSGSSQGNQTKSSTTTVLNQDTVSNDTTRGYLRVQLAADATNTDNVLIEFSPNSKSSYVSNEDARTFKGFGQVSLSSISSDNVLLSINSLPLSTKGTAVKLAVSAKSKGTFKLNLSTIHGIPNTFDIWLKDKFKKDSTNFRVNPSYSFTISSDTTTYGSNRFSVVLRTHK